MTIGVLALQGDVREHRAVLESLGANVVEVRRPVDLEGLDGIVLPGGESTTLSMLLESSGLFGPLSDVLRQGLPAFGTCAGLILLAKTVEDGRPDQRSFGVLDCTVRRNGYGRQRYSFERWVEAGPLDGGPLRAVFIRAPVVVSAGPDVEVLATLGRRSEDPDGPPEGDDVPAGSGASGGAVVVRQGHVLASTFHPELTGDRRLHRLFVAMTGRRPLDGR